ncbi:hypothetical protein L1049_028396 [Liquidambar formosana]|uniref:C2H2-type domain-containing protein n=1 Tax=Liquidambar formosana TaxID=63359 RepID=A0AAP0RIW1_LIQFO
MKKMEVSINGFLGNEKMKRSKHDDGLRGEVSEVELGKNCIKEAGKDQAQLGSNKHNSSKRKFSDSYDPELAVESSKKTAHDASDSEIGRSSHKRSKFECTTCNKVFHSYQALGGHRASHKKIKGCFASRIESSENSIETEVSPDQTTDSKLIKSCNNDNPIDHDLPSGYPEKPEMANKSKKSKGHECPICFKVFSSGQALGGHKRSHLVGTSETKTNQTVVTQKPVSEIRDLLDLNLPAPNEEDSNGHIGFKPWWAGSSHKHEPLVGLISN